MNRSNRKTKVTIFGKWAKKISLYDSCIKKKNTERVVVKIFQDCGVFMTNDLSFSLDTCLIRKSKRHDRRYSDPKACNS